MRQEIERGEIDVFLQRLQSFFAGLSYEMNPEQEKNVQYALLVLFRLIGLRTNVEYRTSDGRIDIVVETDSYVYVMELKFDSSAKVALRQIKHKEYPLQWRNDGRVVYAIGLNYSSGKRRPDEWEIERIDFC